MPAVSDRRRIAGARSAARRCGVSCRTTTPPRSSRSPRRDRATSASTSFAARERTKPRTDFERIALPDHAFVDSIEVGFALDGRRARLDPVCADAEAAESGEAPARAGSVARLPARRSRVPARSRKPDAISTGFAASRPTWRSALPMPRASIVRVRACCASTRGSSRRSRTRSTALLPTRSSRHDRTSATRFARRRRSRPACITCGSIPKPSGAPRIRCRSMRARRQCGSGSTRRGAAIITTKGAPPVVCSCPSRPRWRRRSTRGSLATWTHTCGAFSHDPRRRLRPVPPKRRSREGGRPRPAAATSTSSIASPANTDALELTVFERDAFKPIDASVNWLNDNIIVADRLDVAQLLRETAATARADLLAADAADAASAAAPRLPARRGSHARALHERPRRRHQLDQPVHLRRAAARASRDRWR